MYLVCRLLLEKKKRLEHSRNLAPGARGGLPGPDGLTQFPYPAAVADLGDHLIAPTEEPVEDLRRAKASIQTEHNPQPPLAGPAEARFHLAKRRLQGGHRRRCPPE